MARILTCYYKPKPGGLCTRFFRSIRALLERGHEVHYLAVERYPIDHPACHFHRFPWPPAYTHGLFFWAMFHLLAPLLLLSIGLRRRITNLYAFGTTYAFVLQPLRAIKGVPLALFLRADVLQNHHLSGRPIWLIKIERIIEGLSLYKTCLFGVSKTLTREIVMRHNILRPRTSATLTNEIIPLAVRSNAQVASQPLRLACVGVIEPRKNVRFAIRAIAAIPESTATLTIYGDGPEAAALQRLAHENGNARQVRFAGWCNTSALWAEIDVLLFPSLHEGFPNAVCEAIARGIPVIASDTPEHRELLPTATLLPLVLGPWQQAIEALCKDRNQLIQVAKMQEIFAMRYRFDWNTTVVNCIIGLS